MENEGGTVLVEKGMTPVRGAGWRRVWTMPVVVTGVFLVVCGVMIFRHVMWVDEAQAFLLARDSRSLGELFWNLRYEGHPPLWHLLLYVITRFTVRYEAMQALHLLMAAGSVYLVARYSPLPWLAKVLFPFGYFPLFEYGVISRNYQLVMLLVFAFCALWQWRGRAYVGLGVLIALMSLSHVMGVIIGAGLGVVLVLDAALTRDGRGFVRRHWVSFLVGVLIAGSGAALSVKLLEPPADYGYATGWHFNWDEANAKKVVTILRDGVLPIVPAEVQFWDRMRDNSPFSMALGSAITVGTVLVIGLRWRAQVFYVIAVSGQLAFSYVKFFGGVRHHGGLFIALIAALWIAWGIDRRGVGLTGWRRVKMRVSQWALVGLLGMEVVVAGAACWFAWGVPFTVDQAAGRALARALKSGDVLVADCEFVAPSLAPYVPGWEFEFPAVKGKGTFIVWRKQEPYVTSGLGAAIRIARERGADVVWASRNRVARLPAGVTEVGIFYGSGPRPTVTVIQPMEQLTLYRIHFEKPVGSGS